MDKQLSQALLMQVIDIAEEAGNAIMDIYQTDFAQYQKKDSSPVTEADIAAHNVIDKGLKKFSDLPVLSEESKLCDITWQQRKNWQRYWLIDPLDGTKEFINRNDEFTVNIALIDQGKAVLGVVYAPAIDCLYFAAQGIGAFKRTNKNSDDYSQLHVSSSPDKEDVWKIVGSRRHGAEAVEQFSQTLGNIESVSMGSSLKLCLVAEGKAHLYPRLAPTFEWDTAAAQAIVENAGGKVLKPDFTPITYGQKDDLLNPCFIVCGEVNDRWYKVFAELTQ